MFIMDKFDKFLIKEWEIVKNVAGKVDKMHRNASNVKGKVVRFKCSKLVQVLINKCRKCVRSVKEKDNSCNKKINVHNAMEIKYYKNKLSSKWKLKKVCLIISLLLYKDKEIKFLMQYLVILYLLLKRNSMKSLKDKVQI